MLGLCGRRRPQQISGGKPPAPARQRPPGTPGAGAFALRDGLSRRREFAMLRDHLCSARSSCSRSVMDWIRELSAPAWVR